MPTSISIYCPSGGEGASRGEVEDEVEDFFGPAAQMTGGGGGSMGFNLDFELAEGEDVEDWVHRLRQLLAQIRVRPATFFDVFPDDWESGMPRRRVEVFGRDRWLAKRGD